MVESALETHTLAVGFIGLGDKELPMAAAIAGSGNVLHVWARNPDNSLNLKGVMFTPHDIIESSALASDMVGVCISSDDNVIGLLKSGLLGQLLKDAFIVNHGTGSPARAKQIAELCAEHGIDALDAPVSGGRPTAEERRLTTYQPVSLHRLIHLSQEQFFADLLALIEVLSVFGGHPFHQEDSADTVRGPCQNRDVPLKLSLNDSTPELISSNSAAAQID